MRLNNPPVTQTWIGFTFDYGDHERPWTIQAAREFLARFGPSLPQQEALFERQFEIQEISSAHQPKIVGRRDQLETARARNEEGTTWLQIAEDRLVYNRTRGDGVYLGFESLRDEAVSKMREYVEFFDPTGLRSAELHYVDQIEIPIPPDGRLELEEYFKLRVEIPSEFGPTWYFSTRLFLRPPIEGDNILEVRFQSEPPIPDVSAYRFRIDWHMVCLGIGGSDSEAVKRRLDDAHDCLTRYFRESVTERTWALFQPSEEDE